MPDERDTQTAAPSADGDTSPHSSATATATQEPPAPPAAAETAGEAPASPAPDPRPHSEATREDKGDAGIESAEAPESPDSSKTSQASSGAEEKSAAEKSAADAGSEAADEAGDDVKAQSAAETTETTEATETTEPPKAEAAEAPETKAEDAPADEVKTEAPEAGGAKPTAPEAKAEEAKPEAAEAPETKAEAAPAEEAKPETAEAPAADVKAEEAPAEEAETAADAGEAKPEASAKSEPDTAEATPAAAEAPEAAKAEGDDAEATDDKAESPELDDPALLALREAKEAGKTVSGKVIGWNRGGFHVVIDEVTAFCPASEMELGRPRSPETYMDREMEFKVSKFQRRGRRVVLSRSEVLKSQREEILARLKPGAVVEGTVTSLPDFGAFVDLGGIEGLVHVSEISRTRVKQPRDVLQSGQQVEVKILKIEKGGDRISLSMKELEPDPWKDIAAKYPRGSKFTGKILRHADFGMFVELEPTVEGLVHVSQLEPGQNLSDEALQPGKSLEGWVREVEPKRERISLSLREVPDEDPWKTVQTRFPEGETVEGVVESIAPFGVFITLGPGLTGLLPNSQTGLPRGTNAARAFRPGQSVQVQVLSIDTRRKRVSLGRPGAHVEATKADLQEFRKQQKEQEKQAPSAMEAAFARLGLGEDDEEE